ncbi:Uncharacterised protein [Campylobacter hyointestinalis]|uniref:hypothetical protein n=1 Tax=Campylobacter hyointestinalis TaxID=198 RepID=UPI0007266CC6|nr:hypothetical protein [Campylobacter hyointestinalis]PPB52518.1 hypothetical protein CDQ68_03360 [Campylobacter hyointestinalis subsp. hyointestinalis]PPB53750.1 hypothetical protein CDQ69_05320 [Campylobacter hyointestinalis subsp. hyointestinalis]PPB60613.1 hypothetical protein CDQ72_07335 [Campylobacter hyointestinalis subsp. hyointestinalis]PPB62950.1 hypothetical protein CDQ73_06290 [Campylobacter hyointestinalis subsp. hyointestinalis]CUU68769.1 Uncharacterised protein [Campylobacter h
MPIKDDIGYIKNELSSEEHFLENAIRSERFLRKNKKIIVVIVAILVILLIGYAINSYVKESNLSSANEAYNKLLISPNDVAAMNTLKNKAPSLFALYAIKNAADTNSTNLLDEALSLDIDPLLKNIIESSKNQSTDGILSSYDALLKGFDLLKQNKINQAKIEFAKIPNNSPLTPIYKNLEHYQGK